MKHPFWTPIWFLKFGLGILGGIYLGFTESVLLGFLFLVAAIIGITILANILYAILRLIAPNVVAGWELRFSQDLLFGSEPDEVKAKLERIDYEKPD